MQHICRQMVKMCKLSNLPCCCLLHTLEHEMHSQACLLLRSQCTEVDMHGHIMTKAARAQAVKSSMLLCFAAFGALPIHLLTNMACPQAVSVLPAVRARSVKACNTPHTPSSVDCWDYTRPDRQTKHCPFSCRLWSMEQRLQRVTKKTMSSQLTQLTSRSSKT